MLGHAQIIGRTKAINCVVRDLSDTGAKLGVSNSVRLPAEFDLRFVQRRLTLRVRVKYGGPANMSGSPSASPTGR